MTMMKKLLSIFTSVLMVVVMLPILPGTAYAEDTPEPAEIQDLYTIDGVNYYNTASENFSNSKYEFIKDALDTGYIDFARDDAEPGYKRSMADLWLEVAAAAMFGARLVDGGMTPGGQYIDETEIAGTSAMNMDLAASQSERFYIPDSRNIIKGSVGELHSKNMESLAAAEQYVYENIDFDASDKWSTTGYFRNDNTEGPAAVTFVHYKNSGYNTQRTAAVYFSNFKVVPLFPSDDGTNFVTTIEKDDTSYSNAVASTVKNNSATTATGTQKISNSYTASTTSSVSGSEQYTYQESIKASNEFEDGFFHKFSVEVSFTTSQAFQKGWSNSEGESESNSSEQSVSVQLPPYTNVMLKQKTTNAEAVTKYNCPVGLTFDVTIVIYNRDGVHSLYKKSDNTPMVFTFQGDARKSLKERWGEYRDVTDDDDQEGIVWADLDFLDSYYETHFAEAIELASNYVPISPTGAELRSKLNMVTSEVDGVMPILPLQKIKLDPPSNSVYVNDGSYNNLDYLSMTMPMGKTAPTSYFALSGYNTLDVPYFGFTKSNGSWKVVNANGDEWTGNDAPVSLSKDSASGQTMINAVQPGVCYLKYFIDEDKYTTATNPDHFTTNDELQSTAVIKITVADVRTVSADGTYEGYVDADPEALDADGKLHASVLDPSGKEVEANVTWEAKENSGIDVSQNLVSFTKPGTYHVRACFGDLKSDWVEITAVNKHVHSLQEVAAVEADCEHDGTVAHFACTSCGKLFSDKAAENELQPEDAVVKGGHQLVKTKKKAPTCTKLGNKAYYTCSVCGAIFADKDATEELSEDDLSLPALGHDWTDWETVAEATETKEGKQERFCRNDPTHKQTRVVPTLAHKHKMVKTAKKLPTCTKAGNIMYYTCSSCGWVFTDFEGTHEISPDEVVLPATGHKWNAGKVTKKATTTATGTKEYTCTVCGKTKTTTLAKLPKKANPLAVKGKTVTVKYNKLSKKAQTLKATKVIKFTNKGKGKKTYALSTAKKGSKSFKKYFKINKTSGKVTLKKGLPKGTYKVTVKVKAAGNASYKPSAAKKVTFKVTVK